MSQGLLTRVLREATLFVATEAAVLLSFFLYYAMLASRFSTEEVSWYALMRRVMALAMPVLTLGLAEGLAKYLAAYPDTATSRRLMAVAAALIGACCVALAGAAVLDPEAVAVAFFADETWATYALPFAAFTAGTAVHVYACGYLRGTLRMVGLSAVQFVNLALVPIVVLWLMPAAPFERVILVTGLASLVVGIAFVLGTRLRGPARRAPPTERADLGRFLRFSVTRIPAALVGAGLVSLVPVLAQRHVPVEAVGHLSIAVALLVGVAGTMAPLGAVLLPHVSALWAAEERDRVSGRVHLLIGASLQVFAFMAAQLVLFADLVVEFWLGPAYTGAAGVTRTVLAGALGYGFYNATRTVLDAVSDRPINTMNGALALGVVAALALAVPLAPPALDRATLYAVCVAVGCSVLGIATYRALRGAFPGGGREDLRHFVWGLAAAAGTTVVAILLRPVAVRSLAWLLGVELCVGLLFVALLWAGGVEWVRVFAARMLPFARRMRH